MGLSSSAILNSRSASSNLPFSIKTIPTSIWCAGIESFVFKGNLLVPQVFIMGIKPKIIIRLSTILTFEQFKVKFCL